jgi:hypothetical protein
MTRTCACKIPPSPVEKLTLLRKNNNSGGCRSSMSRPPIGARRLREISNSAAKASPKLIQRFKTFNKKRNKSVYDIAGAVSDQELEAMVKLAIELKHAIVAWLQKIHPELVRTG